MMIHHYLDDGQGTRARFSGTAIRYISPTASAAGSVVDYPSATHADRKRGGQLEHQQHHVVWSDDVPDRRWRNATQTRDGNMVMDAGRAMSQLPSYHATSDCSSTTEMAGRRRANESALRAVQQCTVPELAPDSWQGSDDSITGGAAAR